MIAELFWKKQKKHSKRRSPHSKRLWTFEPLECRVALDAAGAYQAYLSQVVNLDAQFNSTGTYLAAEQSAHDAYTAAEDVAWSGY